MTKPIWSHVLALSALPTIPECKMLGPLCYKLITIVNCYLETGLSCIVVKALYQFIVFELLPL